MIKSFIIAFVAFVSLQYASSSVYAVAIQRNVYLQNPTSTSMDVVWKTDTGGDSVVKYGTAGTYGQQVIGDVGKKTIDGAVGFIHHAKLTGLSPDTLYYYQISTSGTALSPAGYQDYAFKTPPSGGAPFTFAIWGDSGDGSSSQKAVATQVLAKQPNFAIIAGDISYGGSGYGSGVSASAEGSQDAVYFDMYKDTMKSAVFYPVCGNHDGNSISTPNGSLSGCQIVDGDHYLPGGGKMGGGVATTYSTDWGNVHLTVINTNDNITFNSANPTSSSPQMAWAYNDIKNSPQPWKIVVWHHNAWSAGSHSTLTNIRDNVAVMVQEAGAHVALWGHSHSYERFSRFSQLQGIGKGPYYFTIGNGGKHTGAAACGTYSGGPTCVAASGQGSIPDSAGFLYVQVNNDKMTFNYVGESGTTYDTATYSLSEFGPVPTSGSTTAPTVTPGQCGLKGEGDADCDNKIDFVDLEILRKEMNLILTTLTSDFNKDNLITIVDIEIFRRGFYKSLGITPTGPTGVTPVILPPPANLRATCAAPGTQATFNWDSVAGATSYYLLIDDLVSGWNDSCTTYNPGDTCASIPTNSYSFGTTPGHSFRWGLRAYNGLYGTFALGPGFTCTAGSLTVAPTTPVTPVSTVQPTAGPSPTLGPTLPPSPPGSGIWLSTNEIMRLPMSGSAWNNVKSAADGNWGTALLSDGGSTHDIYTLAGALVYVRTGTASYKTKVEQALLSIVGTEADPRGASSGQTPVLAVGRNLVSYIIAADLIGFQDASWKSWLSQLRTKSISPSHGNSITGCHELRPNNFGTHCGASRIAADLYLGDQADFNRATSIFKGWLGDRSAYSSFGYGDLSWQCNASAPVGINPKGCVRNGHSIDGVLPDDQRRAGGFTWPPPKENYVYGGLEGATVTAMILAHSGLDTWNWQDKAMLRAFQWLHEQANYPAEGDDQWQPHIINKVYGTTFPAPIPARFGKNMGWTDWTHAK